MFDLKTYLDTKRSQINGAIKDILRHYTASSRIMEAVDYSLMASGKRLRPVLCLAAAEAVGAKTGKEIIHAACALEMIHTYSLIHDDLPAMDNDDLRRGKPTCHMAFDEATAILAGDALLTFAFQVLSENAASAIEQSGTHLLTGWLDVIQTIARSSGCQGMIEGQMLDISSEGTTLTLEELEHMHTLKTGALIEASIYTGAVLGKGNIKQIQALKIYSKNIGIAFQVVDDILDVEGDPVVMGKTSGGDRIRNKNTYPSLLGIEKSKEFAKLRIGDALQAINFFDNNSDPLRAVANYITGRNR